MCFTTIFYVRLYFSNITIWLLSNDSSVRTSNLSKNIIILIQHRKIVQIAPTNSLCWPLLIFATFYIYLWESFKCYKSFRIFPRKVVFFKKKIWGNILWSSIESFPFVHLYLIFVAKKWVYYSIYYCQMFFTFISFNQNFTIEHSDRLFISTCYYVSRHFRCPPMVKFWRIKLIKNILPSLCGLP